MKVPACASLIFATMVLVCFLVSSSNRPSSTRELRFDPSTVQLKTPQAMRLPPTLPKENRILADGTLWLVRFGGSPCEWLNQKNRIKRIHYHFDDCVEAQLGNRLGGYYGRLLVANALQVPFTLTCGDPNDSIAHLESSFSNGITEERQTVFRILSKHNDAPGPIPTDANGKEYTAEDVCRQCWTVNWPCDHGLDLVADAMVADMKYLAQTESVRNTPRDDAVIHLRLGDNLFSASGRDENKGLFPHSTYSQLLMHAKRERGPINSIGIVTAPFEGIGVRVFDSKAISRSKMIVMDLVSHLQQVFPQARISIHNSPEETPVSSLARLVQARKVAVCGATTFCTEAVLATEGMGFVYRTMDQTLPKTNPWAEFAAERYENIRVYEAPRLSNVFIEKLSDDNLRNWMRNQNPDVGCVSITDWPMFRNNYFRKIS